MDAIKWIFGWMGRRRWRLYLALGLVVVGICFLVVEPFMFQRIIDDVLLGGQLDHLFSYLIPAMVFAVLYVVTRYCISVLNEQLSQMVVYDLRNSLFSRLLDQTTGFFRENRSGDIITKCSGDIDVIRHFIAWAIPKWLECIVMVLGVLIVFLAIQPLYALCLFLLTPLTAFFAMKLTGQIRPAYTAARAQLSKLNTVVQENISGNRVVKAFVREEFETDKFRKENEEYKRLNIYANSIWLKYGPMIESVAHALTIVNLVVGGGMVIAGHITLGQLNIFLGLAWALNDPMFTIGMVVNDTQRFFASCEKVMDLYYAKNDIISPSGAHKPEAIRGEITFEDVRLRYHGTPVLSGVTLHIAAGETVGIMGPTGSGKTSLVSMIGRFIDTTGGRVLIDGVDVRKYDLTTLRSAVGTTMQDVFLFSDTVESNIAYGVPEAPLEQVVASARIADADGFIRAMTDGYDTIVGERGTGLSGGQKQRISLARTLAVEAPILILDDTTSAVDMETEKYIQAGLRALPKRSTTIIIAQRVSSISHADKIIILDDGRIVEQGTHHELMRLGGYYAQTFALQQGFLSEDDAAADPANA